MSAMVIEHPQSNLPVHLTRFIGRTGELDEISRLIATTRILTLTGAGGSGKTRLAREAAERTAHLFARVGWVDLAPISDPALVVQQIMAALHLRDRLTETPVESLIACIGDRQTLLVLDNCEHLIDACATIVERLLRECSGLSVLATSREALGVPSETAWLVPALASEDALQLFVERAQAALPSFSATENNTTALGGICRRLDGMPLAIELAAARVRVLSPEQIEGRLNDVFRLLTGGSRTALPRHRTLRGTMDWSYALLDEREQRLLRRLSVFAGTFSLEAAEAVCAGAPLEVEDILDGVAALVDKSLVVMEPGDGTARYHLLETVRQYGAELLAEQGELAAMRDAHGEYFLNVAEMAAPLLIGGEHEPGLVTRLLLDHDNLRAAAAWALNDASRLPEALRFSIAFFWFWYGAAYVLDATPYREGRQYVDAVLARMRREPHVDPLLQAKMMLTTGLLALAQGDNARSRDELTTSAALMREHGDDALLAYTLSKLGAANLMLNDLPRAMELLREAHAIARPLPPQMALAFVLHWRGTAAIASGDLALAQEMFAANAELGRRTGHRTIRAHSASQLGRLRMNAGEHAEAFSQFHEAMFLHVEIGDAWGLAMDLDGLAALTMRRHRPEDAVKLLGAVDRLRERVTISLPETDKADRVRLEADARTELGDTEFDRLYAVGSALAMEEVLQLASESAGAQTAEYRVPRPATIGGVSEEADAVKPASTLRVLALGPLQVFVDGALVDNSAWGSARPRELLVYLLVHPEGRTREQVGAAFWPEASTAQVRNNFHVTLHRLRKALRHSEWIVLSGERYRVDPAVIEQFDVLVFEREVAAARKALARGEDGAAAALDRALSHYRSDLLDGEPAGDWHLEYRERLQRIFTDSLMEIGAHATLCGRHEKAAEAYRRVLARDDVNEDAALELMRTQARLGERAQALRHYLRFAERLRKELDAEPGEALVELYEELKASA